MTGVAYRPWPPPARPWTMAQTWHDLLFAHWPFPADELRAVVPAALPLDTYAGQAWLGVVPFWMSAVRPRRLPPLPWLSRFPELNVRTYVTVGGKPGVFFFSLDAGNPLAVAVARSWYHLPYYRARMSSRWQDDAVHYLSERIHRGAPPATFRGRYCPTGAAVAAEPGSLAYWLTARYCLYTVDRRQRVYRREIDHVAWPLRPAEAAIDANTMAAPLGLRLPDVAPLLHFARRLEVVVWPREQVTR